MTILVIEDEQKLVDILKKALSSQRYGVDVAMDGEDGLVKAMKNNYDMIILDIMLPKKDGIEVCQELRKLGIHTPVIMLTARGVLADRIIGLDAGADDYLVKPFGLEELFARIRAVLRRRKISSSLIYKIDDLVMDTKKHEVTRNGKVLKLTPKEYRLLNILMRQHDEVLTRQKLIEEAWGPDFVEENNDLNVHIRYLRSKVDVKNQKPLIHTVRGVGYVLKE